MFNAPLMNNYNPQGALDRINSQMAELERMKMQLQQPLPQPTNLTQNFQLSPNNSVIKYADSIEEVKKDIVLGDTPFFSKDMSIVWVKSSKGEIRTYSLAEIIEKDEKDLQIEFLQAQIEELKKGMNTYESIDEYDDGAITSEESSSTKTIRGTKKK